MYELQD
jgi:hypothetical protein